MGNFDEIDGARRLLGLGESATMQEIRNAYRRLAHRHHPDKHGNIPEGNEEMKRLNDAYKVLTDYCRDYRYSFRREDTAEAYPEQEDYRRWHEKWSDSV
jgi:DnaJ-class molecular chaperone